MFPTSKIMRIPPLSWIPNCLDFRFLKRRHGLEEVTPTVYLVCKPKESIVRHSPNLHFRGSLSYQNQSQEKCHLRSLVSMNTTSRSIPIDDKCKSPPGKIGMERECNLDEYLVPKILPIGISLCRMEKLVKEHNR